MEGLRIGRTTGQLFKKSLRNKKEEERGGGIFEFFKAGINSGLSFTFHPQRLPIYKQCLRVDLDPRSLNWPGARATLEQWSAHHSPQINSGPPPAFIHPMS